MAGLRGLTRRQLLRLETDFVSLAPIVVLAVVRANLFPDSLTFNVTPKRATSRGIRRFTPHALAALLAFGACLLSVMRNLAVTSDFDWRMPTYLWIGTAWSLWYLVVLWPTVLHTFVPVPSAAKPITSGESYIARLKINARLALDYVLYAPNLPYVVMILTAFIPGAFHDPSASGVSRSIASEFRRPRVEISTVDVDRLGCARSREAVTSEVELRVRGRLIAASSLKSARTAGFRLVLHDPAEVIDGSAAVEVSGGSLVPVERAAWENFPNHSQVFAFAPTSSAALFNAPEGFVFAWRLKLRQHSSDGRRLAHLNVMPSVQILHTFCRREHEAGVPYEPCNTDAGFLNDELATSGPNTYSLSGRLCD
jgi:hypothetical protein